MKSQFLGRNDKETGTFTGNTRKLSLRSEPKSAWVPNTPSAHKLLIFERQILFSVQLSRANCQQITSKCEVSLHHALHHAYHAYHASYCIILDHIGSQEDFCRLSSCAEGEPGKAAHNTNHIGPRGSGTSQRQSPGFSRNIVRNTEFVSCCIGP